MNESIFVSYTQTTEENNAKVLSFVNYLRKEGYAATCDQILREEQTAIDFNQMMYTSLINAKKVIVVLSKEYKQKADQFKGGTGTEFSFIANHINDEPTKYILITLDNNHQSDFSDVLPSAFNKREVLEVNIEDIRGSRLYNKLLDIPAATIMPVSSNVVLPTTIGSTVNIVQNEHSALESFASDTALFDYRIKGAFPGTRGITTIDNSVDAVKRLTLLLQKPLHSSRLGDPFWYFRGNSCLSIDSFEKLSEEKVLMNVDELLIDKISAYIDPYGDYQRDFIYVQTKPDEPSGAYDIPTDLNTYPRDDNRWDYFYEEFGQYINEIGERFVLTRSEYDDGGMVRNGEVIDTAGKAQLRLRFLTPYNFVICAQFNPFNSDAGDEISRFCLHEMLMGRMAMERFVEIARKLPLNPKY